MTDLAKITLTGTPYPMLFSSMTISMFNTQKGSS